MAKYKCKMCGAPLDVCEGQTVVTCEFCQSKQTVANANDERKENLFNRANALRTSCDFDKAILSYQSILSLFPSEPEAHWGLCLCKYGIEYVDDPTTHKKVPTIHRVSFDSILKDSDYLAALLYADPIAKEEYQEEATEIANIQKNILSISQKEQPFDIFICYKETDSNGKRTHDSVLAQEIYSNLVEKGYKVFFSRITLESKIGTMYEPYIFAALNSAKIMLCIGTKKEYFEAVWVKNEWTRFIDMMATRPDRYFIPCYKDMEAYDMPEQFLAFQGQDMEKLGFMQDLLRGIDKIMGRSETPKAQTTTKIIQTDVNVSALLKRAEILLGDGNFEKADELLERVLDNDPTNSQAYLFKLLIDLRFTTVDELKTLDNTLELDGNFKKAYDFGDDTQKNKLNAINEFINNRNEEARLGRLYDIAMDYKNANKYDEAKAAFSELAGFRDSTQQALECVNLGKENIYSKALILKEAKQYVQAIETFEKIKGFKDSEYQISECIDLSNKEKYTRATELKEKGLFDQASELFMEILSYQDADFQVDECNRLKTEAKKEEIYASCLFDREINPYFDSAALKKACDKLATIPNYKDANQLLVKYEGILKDYEAELVKKREEDARLKAKMKKKIKIISIISSILSLVLTASLLHTFLFLIPSKRQNEIQSLINSRKYEEAMTLIEENGSFGDTENLKSMCNAGKAFESLDYETGIDYIYKIGGSVDVNYDNNGGTSPKYNETIKRLNSYIDNDTNKKGYDFHDWALTGYTLDAKNHNASIDLKAQYNVTTYNVSYNLNGGTNSSSNPSSYTIEDTISFAAPSKTGYAFLGWFDNNGNQVTSIAFGTTGALALTAHWNEGDAFTVTLDANGGEVSRTLINVQYDHSYSLPTPTRLGYTFDGWYDGSTIVNNTGTWRYTRNKTFVAHWEILNYSINYNLNGGTNSSSNPSSYTIEDTITFAAPSKSGYAFLGWFDRDNKVTGIPSGSTGIVNVEARWSPDLHTLSVTSEDTSKGTVAITSGSGYSDESITVVATPIGDCVFKGWYHESTKVSDDATYTFVMPNSNYSLVAHFFTKIEEGKRYAKIPLLSEDGKTITYGLYPQTNVSNYSLISALDALSTTESNGWYLYEGDYYAKVSATPAELLSYKFDNGTLITSGSTYWFKCEPIVWNVLSNNSGEYYIVSSMLLDAHCYYHSRKERTIDGQTVYPNNYKYSDIRTWLNNDFYKSAFALGNSHIQTTTVDNSAATTDNSSNSYACANTQDKVFLPSYQDYLNSSYGFSTSADPTYTRWCKTTDWARARGASCITSSQSYPINGSYWTRSPLSDYRFGDTSTVSFNGDLSSADLSNLSGSVRPSLLIKIA